MKFSASILSAGLISFVAAQAPTFTIYNGDDVLTADEHDSDPFLSALSGDGYRSAWELVPDEGGVYFVREAKSGLFINCESSGGATCKTYYQPTTFLLQPGPGEPSFFNIQGTDLVWTNRDSTLVVDYKTGSSAELFTPLRNCMIHQSFIPLQSLHC